MSTSEAPPDLTAALRSRGLEPAEPFAPVLPAEGASGEVLARAVSAEGTGFAVVLVPGQGPAGELVRDRAQRLAEIHHEHLATVGRTLDVGAGRTAVLVEEVPGTDLRTVQHARGAWAPGEVVTVLVPLAGALATLHRAGLSHGQVGADAVVLRPDGRAVLTDLVPAPGRAAGGPGDVPEDPGTGSWPDDQPRDVHALARLGLDLLSVSPEAARTGASEREERAEVTACLERVVAADPRHRPTAEELAAQLYTACRPMPVTVPEAAVLAPLTLRHLAMRPAGLAPVRRSARTRGRHRRPARRRTALLTATAGAALLGCTAVVWALAGAPGVAADVEPEVVDGGVVDGRAVERAPDVGLGDPVLAAVRLTRSRAEALAGGDLERLGSVTVPGSPAAQADARAAERIVDAGLDLGEVTVEVLDARRLGAAQEGAEHDGGPVRVAVEARVAAQVDEAGTDEGPAGPGLPGAPGAADVVLVLQATADGWRVSDIEPGGG